MFLRIKLYEVDDGKHAWPVGMRVVERETLVVLEPDATHLYASRTQSLRKFADVWFYGFDHAVAILSRDRVIAQAIVRKNALVVALGQTSRVAHQFLHFPHHHGLCCVVFGDFSLVDGKAKNILYYGASKSLSSEERAASLE